MILSGQSIRKRCLHDALIFPFVERQKQNGMSYGLSISGYDVRIDQSISLTPNSFTQASTLEKFTMPRDLLGIVHDNSTLARRGLALQNTVIEAGWIGYLTLEITNHGPETVSLSRRDPICQIIFHQLDEPAEQVYMGKYQDQKRGPQAARFEYNLSVFNWLGSCPCAKIGS